MLRYDVPQIEHDYNVWLELRVYDELPEDAEFREKGLTLARVMQRESVLMITSPHEGHAITHTIPYTDILAAFPDADPETTYLITCYE